MIYIVTFEKTVLDNIVISDAVSFPAGFLTLLSSSCAPNGLRLLREARLPIYARR